MNENLENKMGKIEETKIEICNRMWERTNRIGMHLYSEKICKSCDGYIASCQYYTPKIK